MPFKHINAVELKEMLKLSENDINILDIRDIASYQQGHIKDAIHVSNENVESISKSLDKSSPLIVCCYHGNSSQGAADYFSQLGFQNTFSLDGGYQGWQTS